MADARRGADPMLLSEFARRVLKEGDLTIIDAAGRRHRVGDGCGRSATIRLHDRSLHHRIAMNPYLYVGEAYMDGTLTLEEGSLYDFLDICAANVGRIGSHPLSRAVGAFGQFLRRLHQHNPARRARANAPNSRSSSCSRPTKAGRAETMEVSDSFCETVSSSTPSRRNTSAPAGRAAGWACSRSLARALRSRGRSGARRCAGWGAISCFFSRISRSMSSVSPASRRWSWDSRRRHIPQTS